MKKRKKRKLNVPAGRGIEGLEDFEAECSNTAPEPTTGTSRRRRKNNSDSSDDDDGELSLRDSDS